MRFEGESVINAPREKVWEYISDPRNGLEYVPNIKKLDVISKDKFTATVGIGVAAIKGTFNLDFDIIENVSPSHGKLKASGEGVRSVVNFEAQVDLSEAPDKKTFMRWAADANVGGLIAGVGQRLLRMVADKLIKQGFDQMKSKLEKQAYHELGAYRMDDTPVIYVVKTQCQPQYEKEFNSWYDEIHLPLLRKFKGLRKVTRYRAINSSEQYPEYVVVYEFPNKQIMNEYLNSTERAAALEEMRSTWKKGGWELKGHMYYELLRSY